MDFIENTESEAGIAQQGAAGATEASALDAVLVRVLDALRGLRFGAVELQVHDSRVVRITRTEKLIVDSVRPRADGIDATPPSRVGRHPATTLRGIQTEQRISKGEPTESEEARPKSRTRSP
jgi:hypothetical protein